MTYRESFEPKTVAGDRTLTFDFGTLLASGETISSASVVGSLYSGADTSPSSIISGSASISGTQVSQLVIDGEVGTAYLLTCTVVTSSGQSLVRTGLLVVIA